MRESPRIRWLRSDNRVIQQLRDESTILNFVAHGDPPETYMISFQGQGFWRPDGSKEAVIREYHEVSIDLSASYPRMQPELSWQTPIFHPNISASGVVCLGGYGTYWVPSVNLDELCVMLWDMIRYQNFDVESPYNREAATWTKTQCMFKLPIDTRPLRDKTAGMADTHDTKPPILAFPHAEMPPDVTFIEPDIVNAEIVDAEVVGPEDPDILYIE